MGEIERAKPAGEVDEPVAREGDLVGLVEWSAPGRRRTPYWLGIAIVVVLMALSQVPGALDVIAFVLALGVVAFVIFAPLAA